MRSRFGVGITPPNVLELAKPASSVMISSTLGAPFGGSTRGGQYGVDCAALRSILPPNFNGGFGSCLPLIVVVALGEPGTPVTVCAIEGGVATGAASSAASTNAVPMYDRLIMSGLPVGWAPCSVQWLHDDLA